MLENPAELHLAPRPAHGRGVERTGESGGLGPQRGSAGTDLGQSLAEDAILLAAVPFERRDLTLHPGHGIPQGRQQSAGLRVLGDGGLEVDDALAQAVPLRAQAGDLGGIPRAGDHPGEDDGQGRDTKDPADGR